MWHQKLGHMSECGLKILVERNLLLGLKSVNLPFCEHCIVSKQNQLKFGRSIAKSKYILGLIHSDVWESLVTSLGEAKIFFHLLMITLGEYGCTQSRRSKMCFQYSRNSKLNWNLNLEKELSV